MSPDIEFSYNGLLFNPPAPALSAEWRSPAATSEPNPKLLPALIDTGADCSTLPQILIESLRLQQVSEEWVRGYDDEKPVQKPVYSVHLTVTPLTPILVPVIPNDSADHAIIGRDVINTWLITLNGPKLKAQVSQS
jgi:hypothetical protein